MPPGTSDSYRLRAILEQGKRFAILSHSNPDGDTLGSAMALALALEARGKTVVAYCADPIPVRYRVLADPFPFVTELEWTGIDAAITVDVATPKLITSDILSSRPESVPLVNIDHHKDNAHYGTLDIVDPTAPSTTMMLFFLFDELGIPITPDIATALLLGLVTDTGGFFHSNTNSQGYDVAGRLLSLGADGAAVTRRIFRDFDPKRLKLWGKVLSRASINADQVVSSVVLQSDFRETGTTPQDLEGVVEYLNMVPEGRYAMLLTEDGKNASVKGSLRARAEDVDVSEIAHRYGGGGHKKASGFKIKGKLAERKVWEVVSDEGKERLSV